MNPNGDGAGRGLFPLNDPRRLVEVYRVMRIGDRVSESLDLFRQFIQGPGREGDVAKAAFAHAMGAGETDLARMVAWACLERSPEDPQWHNANGLALVAAGEQEKAVSAFESAVRLDPEMAVAHGNFALALRATGDMDRSIDHLKTAIRLCPTCEDYYYDLGNALRESNRWDEARTAYEECLSKAPDHSAARLNLAKGLADHGDIQAAIAGYKALLERMPEMPEALNNLGLILLQTGDAGSAVDYLKKAAENRPDRALYHFNLGRSHQAAGNSAAAVEAYRSALVRDPTMAMAHANIGAIFKAEKQYAASLEHLERSRDLEPDNVEMLVNLGNLYERLDRYDDAANAFQCALSYEPENQKILINYGTLLNVTGESESAADCFRKALTIDPMSADAAFNLAITDLLLGRYAEGWARYGNRFQKTGWKDIYPHPCTEFDGRLESGMRLLIHDEQGLGDTIQFARYLPLVKALGVHITFETRPPLIPLFQRFPGIDRLETRSVAEGRRTDVDAVISLLSLPRLMLDTAGTHPEPVPFPIDPDMDKWGRRLGNKRPRIGIVWAGNPVHDQDRRRSVDIRQLMSTIGSFSAAWFSLQKGTVNEPGLDSDLPLITALGPELNDFEETAAVISQLDLVITVDTAVAHLAGSMGIPVWILLPFAPDWRWERFREDSPWYPSARLFRQPAPQQWQPVFDAVADALERQFQRKKDPMDQDAAGVWFHKAARAAMENRMPAAETAIRRCLEMAPDHADALNLAAVLAHRLDDYESARKWIRKAAAAAPDHPDIAVNQGRIALAMGDPFEAETAFARALERSPGHADAQIHLGELYRQTGRARVALDGVLPLMDRMPDHLPLLLLLCRLNRTLGDLTTALKFGYAATTAAPNDPDSWNQLGVILAETGQEAEAEAALSKSLRLNPLRSATRVNMAAIRLAQGDIDAARRILDDAVTQSPEDPDARFNRAQILLMTGDWKAGWQDYAYRCRRLGWRRFFFNPHHRPVWAGESFIGKTLWIVAEQGYGDMLQMIRFAPEIKSRGGDVVVVADSTLHPILKTVPGVDRVLGIPKEAELEQNCHWVVPVMSLPGILDVNPDQSVPSEAYLTIPEGTRSQWLESISGDEFRVGLVWAGSPTHTNDRRRSLTFPQLSPILGVPGARFFSLQTGPAAGQLEQSLFSTSVMDIGRHIGDFGDTACAMAALDLIITVDTATAHLAGGLGRPVWTLLPQVPDWRWGLDRSDTPWYPSMRLFRQEKRDDWSAPVAAVASALTSAIRDCQDRTER